MEVSPGCHLGRCVNKKKKNPFESLGQILAPKSTTRPGIEMSSRQESPLST